MKNMLKRIALGAMAAITLHLSGGADAFAESYMTYATKVEGGWCPYICHCRVTNGSSWTFAELNGMSVYLNSGVIRGTVYYAYRFNCENVEDSIITSSNGTRIYVGACNIRYPK